MWTTGAETIFLIHFSFPAAPGFYWGWTPPPHPPVKVPVWFICLLQRLFSNSIHCDRGSLPASVHNRPKTAERRADPPRNRYWHGAAGSRAFHKRAGPAHFSGSYPGWFWGCHSLLQGIFPTQGSTHVSWISCISRLFLLPSSHQGIIIWQNTEYLLVVSVI